MECTIGNADAYVNGIAYDFSLHFRQTQKSPLVRASVGW